MKKPIIIAIIVLAVGGIIGILYTQIWNPSWNPFRPVPTVVLAKMALKMKGLEAFHIEGIVNTEDIKKTSYEYVDYYRGEDFKENINSKETKDSFKISLDVDKEDAKNKKNYLIVEGEHRSDSVYGESTSSYDSSGKLELKKMDDLIYFFLTDTSKSGGSIEDTKEVLLNQWIKLNQEEIGDLANFWLEEMGGGIDVKISKERQEELVKEIIKLFISRNIFEAKEELSDEKINGQMNYHYSLVLNERETKRLVSDIILKIAEFVSDSISVSESTSPEYFREEYIAYFPMMIAEMNMGIQKEIGDFFEQMEGVNIEVWIGQRDGYLHRVKFEREKDLVDYFEEELSEYSREKILEAERSVLVDINFSEFNKPIEIKPPENTMDLEQIIRDAKRESDMKQINSSSEDFYYTNKEYPRLGEYEGVGLAVALINREIKVAFSVENSPASKAGLKLGDKIIKINGFSTVGMTVDNAGNMLSGPKGTVVTLIVYRDEWGEEREVRLIRSVIEAPLVVYSRYSLSSTFEIKDPGQGPCPSYQRIPNSNDLQRYCVWACLENGKFFAASEKGTKLLEQAPTDLDCW